MGATVLATSACGPAVLLPGETESGDTESGDTETDGSDTEIPMSTSSPSSTTPPNPTETVECYTDEDCPGSYFDCIDNQCIEEYYCLDCCYDDCYYAECYADDDCGIGSICNDEYGYGDCEAAEEIPPCELVPELDVLPIQTPGYGSVRSLAFVEHSGTGEELLIGHQSGASIVYSGATSALPALASGEAAVVGAAAGEFTNEPGVRQLALALESPDGSVALYQDQGGTAFDLVAEQGFEGRPPVGLHTVRNAGGYQDFIVPLVEFDAVRLLGDAQPFAGVEELGFQVFDVVTTDPGPKLPGQVFTVRAEFDQIVVEDVDGERTRGLRGRGGRRLAVGRTSEEVHAVSAMNGWLLIETLESDGSDRRAAILSSLAPQGETLTLDAGDVDGNGFADVVIVEGTALTVAFRDSDRFSCYATVPLEGLRSRLAVGDWRNDGIELVAVSDGAIVEMLTLLPVED